MRGVGSRRRALKLALAALGARAGCSAPGAYQSLRGAGAEVAAYKCVDSDGDDAGTAYFDPRRGLAMMALSMGIDLPGRTLAPGPMMVGEVYFGPSRVVFKIPRGGGPSEVSMFPPADQDSGEQPQPKVKRGRCVAVAEIPPEQRALIESIDAESVRAPEGSSHP